MPRNTRRIVLKDFSGGLYLRAGLSAPPNTLAECINFLPRPEGGLVQRLGVVSEQVPSSDSTTDWNRMATGTGRTTTGVAFFSTYVNSQASTRVVRCDTGAAVSTDLTGKWWFDAATTPDGTAMAWSSSNPLDNNPGQGWRIDGNVAQSVLTASGSGQWQESYSGSYGSSMWMPRANTVAWHKGYLFVGDTFEDGARQYQRVRWSHPGKPWYWRSIDYVDVGASSLDRITALQPFRDHLLIFTWRGTYALYGYSPETWSLVQISSELGSIGFQTTVADDSGVYFFDPRRRSVWMWNGSSFRCLSDAIENANWHISGTNSISLTDQATYPWMGSCGEYLNISLRQASYLLLSMDKRTGAWSRHGYARYYSDGYLYMTMAFWNCGKVTPGVQDLVPVLGFMQGDIFGTNPSVYCVLTQGIPGQEALVDNPHGIDFLYGMSSPQSPRLQVLSRVVTQHIDFGDKATMKMIHRPTIIWTPLTDASTTQRPFSTHAFPAYAWKWCGDDVTVSNPVWGANTVYGTGASAPLRGALMVMDGGDASGVVGKFMTVQFEFKSNTRAAIEEIILDVQWRDDV